VFFTRSLKNWVCNFLIFPRVSTDFLRFNTRALLFEIRFYTEVLATFYKFTTIPSLYKKLPRKEKCLAMLPLGVGWGRRGRPEFRRHRRRSWPRRSAERCASSPKARLWPELGRRGNRRWCLPMPSSGGRGGLGSGDVRARSGLKAAGEASVGTHGHVGMLKQWRPRAEKGTRRWWRQWRGGTGMARLRGGRPLNRRLSRARDEG
jgi:hypothetical protein